VAVSGGPDSLALLLLAQAVNPDCVEAATVDHGLRPESEAEAEAVASICSTLGIAHRTLRVRVGDGNLQDAARMARYAALGGWAQERGLACIATAHHADDQAETVLMRLNRASGLRGLASIRAANVVSKTGTLIVRPLLQWRKVDLERIVTTAGIAAVVDPSNADARFDRSRVRAGLSNATWLDPVAVARSATRLAEAAAALDWAIEREWGERVREEENGLVYLPADAPSAIRLGVLERMIASNGVASPRGGEIAALAERLREGGKATLGGAIVEVRDGAWRVRPEPGRR
jgi:tRNA(Ile)-lysidine synthase